MTYWNRIFISGHRVFTVSDNKPAGKIFPPGGEKVCFFLIIWVYIGGYFSVAVFF